MAYQSRYGIDPIKPGKAKTDKKIETFVPTREDIARFAFFRDYAQIKVELEARGLTQLNAETEHPVDHYARQILSVVGYSNVIPPFIFFHNRDQSPAEDFRLLMRSLHPNALAAGAVSKSTEAFAGAVLPLATQSAAQLRPQERRDK